MSRICNLLLAAVWIIVTSPVAHAWDRIGHMVVAGIAFDELSPEQQKKLFDVLSHLANNDRMLAGLGNRKTHPRAIVMAASTWPDLIKVDPRYFDNGANRGYDEPGPLRSISATHGSENDKLPRHKGWHFIDTPVSLDNQPPGAALDGTIVNIVQVLTVLNKQLGDPQTGDEERAFELAWLLHLVGDIHQPLHCANGFDAQNPKPRGDVGGNNIRTDDPITHETELHAFWDNILGKDTATSPGAPPRLDLDVVKASSVINTLHGISPAADGGANDVDTNFQKWADETHKLAVDDAYGQLRIETVPADHGDAKIDKVTIDQPYHDLATRIAEQQVVLAGHRLAALLRTYLK